MLKTIRRGSRTALAVTHHVTRILAPDGSVPLGECLTGSLRRSWYLGSAPYTGYIFGNLHAFIYAIFVRTLEEEDKHVTMSIYLDNN